MMKLSLSSLVLIALFASCRGAAFDRRAFFGVPARGGGGKDISGEVKREDDYEAAERRIFEAEKYAVEAVEKAIEDEVETIFHEIPHHEKKQKATIDKDKAVKEGKRDEGEKQDDYEAAEEKIFHAVEDAEKRVLSAAHKAEQAVEHAIADEVETFFPSDQHKKT